MKQLLIIFLISNSIVLSAQNVAINNSGAVPDPSAMLDVQSDSKGLLVPRMSSANRMAIPAPAVGLIVYDLDDNSFYCYAGSSWVKVMAGFTTVVVDADSDTKIDVEQSADEDVIHFELAGTERWQMVDSRLEPQNTGGSVFIGEEAGFSDIPGDHGNVAIGRKALTNSVARAGLVAVGDSALWRNSLGASQSYHASANTAVGSKSLQSNTIGSENTALGFQSLMNNSFGTDNTAIGYLSLYSNSNGLFNTAVGNESMKSNTTAWANTAIGYKALSSNTGGWSNTAVGYLAMQDNGTGQYNTGIGRRANANNVTGSNNTSIGFEAGAGSMTHSKSGTVHIGNRAGLNDTTDNTLYIHNSSSSSPLIYGEFDTGILKVNGKLQASEGFSDLDGDTKIEVEQVADEDTIRISAGGIEVLKIDNKTLHLEATGSSLFVGSNAGKTDDGSNNQNTFIGVDAGKLNASGASNTAIGHKTLTNSTGGNENTVIGHSAAIFNTTGDQNTVVGREANLLNQSGSKNTILGYQAGRNTSTSSAGNVFLGYRAGYSVTGSNRLVIANTNTGNPLIYGEFDNELLVVNGEVGIGTSNPSARLQVEASSGEDALRARVNGSTKLMVHNNGGVSIGSSGAPATNGLYVVGDVGIGVVAPATVLHISGGTDTDLTGGGFFTLGVLTGQNISIDNNEIQARNNAAASNLFLQAEGGQLAIGTTSASDKLHVNSSSGENAFRVQVNGSTKFRVYENGGISLFANTTPVSNGLFMELGMIDLEFKPSASNDFRILPTDWGYGEIGHVDFPFHEVHSNSFFGVLLPPSDRRFKEDFRPIDNPVALLQSLNGLMYAFKDDFYNRGLRRRDEYRRTHQLGMIAQEVEQVLPQLVYTDEETGLKSLEYMGLIPILVEAIKDQQDMIRSLEATGKELEMAMHTLQQELRTVQQNSSMAPTSENE